MAENCWLCKVLFKWKYADSTSMEKEQEYKKELSKIYAKAKYSGTFLKILSLGLGFIYFMSKTIQPNDPVLIKTLGIAVIVLLAVEACRIVLLPRCIENEMNNKCVQETRE